MSGFNTSTKSDNFSVKLKAQNIKNAQSETKKLELESRKMEERLRELKVAMGKEKEQREKQGGFWKKGKTGSLNSYATEVLDKKKSPKDPKKRGVKLLKDEKIVLPNRSGDPGTMKYIAESQCINSSKVKTLKCGQCEERSASVSCVQCAEYFCAGCFSAFHYKGALKRHRTVPLHASGPRQCMSPRVSAPPSSRSQVHGSAASAVSSVLYQNNDRSSPIGASGSINGKSSLLTGSFDEDESAASFKNAVMAWRNNDSQVISPERKRIIPLTSPGRPVSRVITPTVMMETSTSTLEQKSPIEIKFTNNGVSYADRLLLKKHRRTEVGQLATPRLTSAEDYIDDEANYDDLEPVNFQSLYEAMVPSSTTPSSQRMTESSLSIIELDNTPKRKHKHLEQTSDYQVEEVSDLTAWSIQNSKILNSKEETLSTESLSTPSFSSPSPSSPSKRSSKNNTDKPLSQNKDKENVSVTKETKTSKDKQKVSKDSAYINEKEKTTTPRPKSSRMKSSTNRPSSARSRPASRAKSRAMSRMQIEGVLTKTPTPALQEVAKMAAEKQNIPDNVFQYRSVFDEIFSGAEIVNRPETPRLNTYKKKDIKVSFTLYQMAPRSWRPDSSLGETVSSDAVTAVVSDSVLACLPDVIPTNPVTSPNSRLYTDPSETSNTQTPFDSLDNPSLDDSALNHRRSRLDHQEERCHEYMAPRTNKHHSKLASATKQEEMEDNEVMRRDLYSRESVQRDTDLMTPVNLDEISCKTETPKPTKSPQLVQDYNEFDVDNYNQTEDDIDTLGQLEWELASVSGRITAEGKISRLSLNSNSRSNSSCSTVRNSLNDQGYDINTRLREDELVDSDDENLKTDRDEVLALK